MKKLSIIFCLFLLAGAVSAADVQILAKETTVNALMENGWKLHTVSSSDYIITYTLIKKSEVVTCKVGSMYNVECFKP